jgi:hypothetical protein
MVMAFSPFWGLSPEEPMPSPLFGDGVRPVAMEPADIQFLLGCAMRHTDPERPPERPIIGLLRKGLIAMGVVES